MWQPSSSRYRSGSNERDLSTLDGMPEFESKALVTINRFQKTAILSVWPQINIKTLLISYGYYFNKYNIEYFIFWNIISL